MGFSQGHATPLLVLQGRKRLWEFLVQNSYRLNRWSLMLRDLNITSGFSTKRSWDQEAWGFPWNHFTYHDGQYLLFPQTCISFILPFNWWACHFAERIGKISFFNRVYRVAGQHPGIGLNFFVSFLGLVVLNNYWVSDPEFDMGIPTL